MARLVERLVDALAGAGLRTQQFGCRARDPAPDDAGQLVVLAPQPLRFALRYRHRIAAVASHQEQRRFPDLALVRHHHDLINPDGAVQFHPSDRQGWRTARLPRYCWVSEMFSPYMLAS